MLGYTLAQPRPGCTCRSCAPKRPRCRGGSERSRVPRSGACRGRLGFGPCKCCVLAWTVESQALPTAHHHMAPSRGDAGAGVVRRARVCRAVRAVTGVGAMLALVLLASPMPTAGEAAFCASLGRGQGRRQGDMRMAQKQGAQGQGRRGRQEQQRPPMAVALAGLVGGGAVAFPAMGGRLGLGSGVMDEELLNSRRYTDPTYGRHVNTPQSVPRPKCIPGARRVRGGADLAPLPSSVEALLHAATLLVDDDRHTLICARPSTATALLHKLCVCVLPHSKHQTTRALLLGDHRFTTLVKALTRALPSLSPPHLTSFLSALARLGHQPGEGFMGLVEGRVREVLEGGSVSVSGAQAVALAHALARLPKTTAYGGVRRGRERALRQAQGDEQARAGAVLCLLKHFCGQRAVQGAGEAREVAHAMRALALLPSSLACACVDPVLVSTLLTATSQASLIESLNAQDLVGLVQGVVALGPMAAAAGPRHEALVRTAATALTARAFPLHKKGQACPLERVVLWRLSDSTAMYSGLVSLLPYVPPPPPLQLQLMRGHARHVAKRHANNKNAQASMECWLRRLGDASEVCMQAMASLSNPNSDSRGEGAITAVLQVPTRFDHVALALAAKRLASLYGEEGARGEGPRPALVEALVYEASVMAHVKGTGGFDARSAATTAQALRHMGIGTPQGKAAPPSPPVSS